MHDKSKLGSSHLLRAAILLSFGGCGEADAPYLAQDAPRSDAEPRGAPVEALQQQAEASAPPLVVGAVSATGAGCKAGSMNVFAGPDYVHFFLTDLKLQSQDPPAATQSAGCTIKAQVRGRRGVALRLQRAVTIGSMYLQSGSTGTYGFTAALDGTRAFPDRTTTARGPYFDSWQELYESPGVATKCGQDASLTLDVPLRLAGTTFGSIKVSDVIVSFGQTPCTP